MSDAADGDTHPPRPQYGEYATPEEQRARIREPGSLGAPVPPPPTAAARPAPSRPTAALTPGRMIDRAVAVGLLVYGLLSMITAVPALLDPASLLGAMGLDAGQLGVTSTGVWGILAVVVLLAGWLLTAWLTWRAHRRGWIVCWIPLAGGFVFNALSGILVAIGLLTDPNVLDAVLRQTGG